MVVILDGKGLEAPLPDVPCGAVMAMVALGVRREQPLHPTSQIAIMTGPQYQVEVVGHEAIAEQVHRQASASADDRLDEGIVIARLCGRQPGGGCPD